MIRVIFDGPALAGFPEECDGANCKLLLPEPGEDHEAFTTRLANGPTPVRRTYTIRKYDPDTAELTIDFVDHGDNGPASAWANAAQPGSFLALAGPGKPKILSFEADWYLIAADLSALPVASVTLEALPRDAQGVAIFEVPSQADAQDIEAPAGIDIHWIIQTDSHTPSSAQEVFIRNLDWPKVRVQTCIAGESGVIKSLRAFLHNEKQVPRKDTYISGYWKIGLVEDEHQKMKRAEA
jgi:NADPH-dependent ferric siderophore reductase